MKKNIVFLAGLLFILAVEIWIAVDGWQSRRSSPAAAAGARAAPR